jgi:hypothetical protein
MLRRYPAPPSPRARVLRFVAFALPIAALGVALFEYVKAVWK